MPTTQEPERQVADADRRQELVLHRLRPHVEEHRVGDLELADADDRQRHRADQDERRWPRRQLEKARHQADGQHAHHRPEQQLEEEEDVARAHERSCAAVEPPRRRRPQRASSTKTSSSSGSRTCTLRIDHPLGVQGAEQLGQPLLGLVHRALDPAVDLGAPSTPGRLGEPRAPPAGRARRAITSPMPDLALELVGRAPRQDPAGLDERDLVAQLLGLAHVVGRQDDRDARASPEQRGDVLRACAPRRRGRAPASARRGRAARARSPAPWPGPAAASVRSTARCTGPARYGASSHTSSRLVHAAAERPAAQAVEPPVERDDLADPQAPQKRRPAAGHVEPAPERARRRGRRRGPSTVTVPRSGVSSVVEDRQERRLAGAVGAEHADDRAARHRQRRRRAAPRPRRRRSQPGAKCFHDLARVDREHRDE